MKFENYKISSIVKKNLKKMGFIKPTDIQYKSIPSILRGEDVLAIAQTGTGKTAAFAIPLISKIQSEKTSKRTNGIKCLIMVPTRELSLQIGNVFNDLAKGTLIKTFTLHGGVEQNKQIETLQHGIDILISTPGRMFDLINQKYIDIQGITNLVLDEADQMLDLGFIDDIMYVKKMLKKRHQTLFFSATINKEIKKLAFSQVKSDAIRIQISPKDPVSKNVSHFVMFTEVDQKRYLLESFIKDKEPNARILIFVRTKIRAERVLKAMERAGIKTETLHSDKTQQQRSLIMESFRSGETPIIITTDLTARGIDIPNIEYVVNYDLPTKAENYVHRVGRTGRGLKKGTAVSFASMEEKELLEEIQTFLNKNIEVVGLSEEDEITLTALKYRDLSLEEIIADQDAWEEKKKMQNSKKKKKKGKRS